MNSSHCIRSIFAGMCIGTAALLATIRWMQLHVLYISVMRRCADGALVNVMWSEDCRQWVSPWRGGLLWLAVTLVLVAVLLIVVDAGWKRS